jgi:hypothetical protein
VEPVESEDPVEAAAPAEPVAVRPVDAAPLEAEVPDPDELDELLLEDLVVPLADTTSPTCPESETIVPSSGA